MSGKFLLMTIGLPRSGKTAWVKRNLNPEDVVVSGDEIRKIVYGQRFWQDGETLMLAISSLFMRMLMEQGKTIIVDECNVTRKCREPILEMAKRYGYYAIGAIFPTSKEECLRRADITNDDIIKPVIERMAANYQAPELYEGFDELVQVQPDDRLRLLTAHIPILGDSWRCEKNVLRTLSL